MTRAANAMFFRDINLEISLQNLNCITPGTNLTHLLLKIDAVLFSFQGVTYTSLCSKYGLCLRFLVIVRVEGNVFLKSLVASC